MHAILLAAILSQLGRASAVPAPGDAGPRVQTLGLATPGTLGLPGLRLVGAPVVGRPFALRVERARPSSVGCLLVGLDDAPVPLPAFGGVLHPSPLVDASCFDLDARGGSPPLLARAPVDASAIGLHLVAQAVVLDPAARGGLAFTQAVRARFGAEASDEPLCSPLFSDRPYGLAAADYDRDGYDDLALVEFQTRLELLHGQDDGTLRPGVSMTIGPKVVTLVAGDLDADGIVDLVAGDDQDGQLNAFLGAGNGTFPLRRDSDFGTRVRSITLGDLDADGFLDAVVSDFFGRQVHVMAGDGDGGFSLTATHSTGASLGNRPFAALIEDFDADGDLDFIVGLEGSKVRYFDGQGDGSFGAAVNFPVASTQAAGLVAGDFDLDGDLDVAVHSGGTSGGTNMTTLSLLPGRGDGTFEPGVQLVDLESPGAFAGGDFDGDGVADFAITDHNRGTTQIWRGSRGGPRRFALAPGLNNANFLVTGDFDGDGACDLALGSVTDGLVVLAGHGDATFGGYLELGRDASSSSPWSGIATGDFDGDQLQDVALIRRPALDGLHVLRGSERGAFVELPLDPALVVGAGPSLFGVAAADLDLDGDHDLLVHGAGGVQVLLAHGSSFAPGPLLLGAPGATQVYVGDLDGDLLPDLLVVLATSLGEVRVLLGRGDGTFLPPSAFSIGDNIRATALADLDGDGLLDVAFGTFSNVQTLLGRGDGSFSTPSSWPSGGVVFALAVADLEQDGLADIVVSRAGSTPGLCILRGSAPGVFVGCALLPGALPFSGPIAVEDLDRDGILDLTLGTLGHTRFFRGRGDGRFDVVADFATPGSGSTRLRDLDGDLLPDFLLLDLRSGVFLQRNRTLR